MPEYYEYEKDAREKCCAYFNVLSYMPRGNKKIMKIFSRES